MKVFTDQTETTFFKTDDHVKNLHAVEIKTIKDFVFKFSLDAFILLGGSSWMVTRFDELVTGGPDSDRFAAYPLLITSVWMNVDAITNGMSQLDVFVEILKYVQIDSDFIVGLITTCGFYESRHAGEDDSRMLGVMDDDRLLQVNINELNEVSTQFIVKT